jgi:hypothetical protein
MEEGIHILGDRANDLHDSHSTGLFGRFLKRSQDVVPQLLKIAAQLRKPFRIQAIDTPVSRLAYPHQPRFLENAQMLGNGRLAHRDNPGKFIHRAGTASQPLKNGASGGVGKRFKGPYISHY